MSSKKDNGNQNPKSKSGKRLSKNKGQKNSKEVSQSQTDSPQQSADKNKEESKNPDSQSFETDSLSLAVKDIEKNLAKENASSSVKSKNDEKEWASSMPQTSSTDIGESSPEDDQKEAKPSLEMDGRASPLELSTIVEEAEVTEQDMEMLKCDSQQIGQGQPEKESKISGAMVGDVAGNQPEPSGLETATGDQAGLSAPEAATGDQAGLSAPEAATVDQAGLSAPEAATGDQAGLSAPEAATGDQAGLSAPEAATGDQAGLSAPEAATGDQAGLSAPGSATGDQAGPSAPEAATGDQAGPSAPGSATGDQPAPQAAEAAAEDGFVASSDSDTELPAEPADNVFPRTVNIKRFVIFGTYPFLQNNSATSSQNPFNEAIESLCDGDIVHAILCFEAFLKPRPPYVTSNITCSEKRAWLCLGITLAAIHQDILAIIALKVYLYHEPNNLNALILLSLCYTYENYKNLTLLTLWEWLSRNPKYSDLVNTSPPDSLDDLSAPFNRSCLQTLLRLFKEAAAHNPPDEVDCDLQCGLGLLYNLRKKYRKASLCFRAAILMNPQDETMWYHLGESLMNWGKYDEAMDAYNLALHYRPDYVRAHYKMGITYAFVQDYPNALKQYMVALSILVETARGQDGTLYEEILNSSKKVVVDMGRPDLLPAVQGQNLEVLSRACGFQYSNYTRIDVKNNAFRILKNVFSP